MMRWVAAFVLIAFAGVAVAEAAGHARGSARKLANYTVIVVKGFTSAGPATSSTPAGLDSMIHARAVQELQAKAIFNDVIDAAPATSEDTGRVDARVDLRASPAQPGAAGVPGVEPPANTAADRRVILNGTILSFSSGNRAARYLSDGLGAGESKLKIRFTLTDAKTGAGLMNWTEEGAFKGALSPFGGSANQAMAGATNGVVKRLIKQIENNR